MNCHGGATGNGPGEWKPLHTKGETNAQRKSPENLDRKDPTSMQFHWDNGNIDHIALHQITPQEAEQVIQNDPIDTGVALRNGELRTIHLGETDAGRILFVVATERDGMCRVVTARPADRKERAFYSNHKAAINDEDPTDT
jgi:uncharacterized DUF497 family protein